MYLFKLGLKTLSIYNIKTAELLSAFQDLIWLSNCDSLTPVELLKFSNTNCFPEIERVHWERLGLREDLKQLFRNEKRDTRLDYIGKIPGRGYRELRHYKHKHGMQVGGGRFRDIK